MNTLSATPALSELYSLISKVDSFPVSVDQLIELAKDSKAPGRVIDFYGSFGHGQVFYDREDLLSRSEQVDIMREEERSMPQEIERGPEDY